MRMNGRADIAEVQLGTAPRPDRVGRWSDPGIRTHLMTMVLLAVAPLLALGGFAVVHLTQVEREHLRGHLLEASRGLTLTMDQKLAGGQSLIRGLSGGLLQGALDLAAFDSQARQATAGMGGWIILLDGEGRQLVNTLRPYGTALPMRPADEDFQAMLRTPRIGNLRIGLVSHAPGIGISLPVSRSDGRVMVLVLAFDAREFAHLFTDQKFPQAWGGTLLDRRGALIVDQQGSPFQAGQPVPETVRSAVRAARQGIFEHRLEETGSTHVMAFAHSPASGWVVMLDVPSEFFEATLRHTAWLVGAVVIAILLLAMGLATWSAWRVGMPLRSLMAAARALESGRVPHLPVPGVREVTQVGQALIGAASVLRENERRRANAELGLRARNADLAESEERFRRLADTIPAFVWIADAAGRPSYLNERWFQYTGLHRGGGFPSGWDEAIHPEDRERWAAIWQLPGNRPSVHELEIRYRQADGQYRWFIARAQPVADAEGIVRAWFGTSFDIEERRSNEEHQRLLMAELDHRVKNILATVQAVAWQSLDKGKAARTFSGRIGALAKAHNLLAESRWRGAALRTVLDTEFEAHRAGKTGTGKAEKRVILSGPDLMMNPRTTQTLTLVFHELTTNAVKYGALSVPQGRLEVTWSLSSEIESGPALDLRWVESGGPEVQAPDSARLGFGSRLIDFSVRYDLGGEASLE
jgi:PAS domain S-box-containing protein